MSKIKIVINPPVVRYGNHAQPLSPGFIYTVENTPLIQDLISEGFAVLVVEESALETEKVVLAETNNEEQKTLAKNSKKPETASSTSEENSHG